jgi:hypothetical protein
MVIIEVRINIKVLNAVYLCGYLTVLFIKHGYENGQNTSCDEWELSSQPAEVCGLKEQLFL